MAFYRFLLANARWLLAGLILSFTSSFGQTYFVSIFADEIMGAFSLSDGQWGASYTIGTAASAVVMVWAGGLTDVFRVRVLAPVIFVLLGLSCVFMAVNTWSLLLPFAIFCLRLTGQGMSSQMMTVAIARWFSANRGRALAVASLGFAIGQASLPYLFVQAKSIVDWRTLWIVAAVIAVVAILPLVLLLKEERTPQSISESARTLGMDARHWTRREMFGSPLFWCLVPAILGPAAWNTALFFQQVHLAGSKGWDHSDFVALIPLFTAVAVAATFLSGALIDRFGSGVLMAVQAIPMVLGFFLIWNATSLFEMGIALCLIAISSGAMATLPGAFAAEFYGTKHIGGIKAIWAAIMVLGSAIGPGVTGWFIDRGIAFFDQSLWIAAYFICSTILLILGVRHARARLPKPT